MNPIEKNAKFILNVLVENNKEQYDNSQILGLTNLSPQDISDAISYLNDLGALESYSETGMKPFDFSFIRMKTRGRYLYNEIKEKESKEIENNGNINSVVITKPINPVGSPYGFTEEDWETVALQKEEPEKLYVVLGLQFSSEFYDTESLKKNVELKFSIALKNVSDRKNENYQLVFESLSAGLGEHLFNEIARNIIGADIAVFDTSNLNPNVMIELGVALTWGTRVLPIRAQGSEKPPSDISGQTWIEYSDSFNNILDTTFNKKLEKMIQRSLARKKK